MSFCLLMPGMIAKDFLQAPGHFTNHGAQQQVRESWRFDRLRQALGDDAYRVRVTLQQS